jgi:hypothetical protein
MTMNNVLERIGHDLVYSNNRLLFSPFHVVLGYILKSQMSVRYEI